MPVNKQVVLTGSYKRGGSLHYLVKKIECCFCPLLAVSVAHLAYSGSMLSASNLQSLALLNTILIVVMVMIPVAFEKILSTHHQPSQSFPGINLKILPSKLYSCI